MFGALWKNSSKDDEERSNRYAEHLSQLVEYFPIGDKVNYYPEYQQDICFETIILGYELNGKALYEREHISKPEGGGPEFVIEQTGETIMASDMPEFALIVPDTTELEKTLDYFSKAAIGRSGQFLRGNSITLLSRLTQNGTPSMDTSVARRTLMKDGHFQGYNVVYLEPRLDTLSIVDHRQQARLALSLASMVFPGAETETGYPGTLINASEHCVGLKLGKVDASSIPKGTIVRLCIPMPSLQRTFNVSGKVLTRHADDTVIVELEGIEKDGAIEPMQLVDRLDLRACLVQCSRENRSQGGGDSTIELVA